MSYNYCFDRNIFKKNSISFTLNSSFASHPALSYKIFCFHFSTISISDGRNHAVCTSIIHTNIKSNIWLYYIVFVRKLMNQYDNR